MRIVFPPPRELRRRARREGGHGQRARRRARPPCRSEAGWGRGAGAVGPGLRHTLSAAAPRSLVAVVPVPALSSSRDSATPASPDSPSPPLTTACVKSFFLTSSLNLL